MSTSTARAIALWKGQGRVSDLQNKVPHPDTAENTTLKAGILPEKLHGTAMLSPRSTLVSVPLLRLSAAQPGQPGAPGYVSTRVSFSFLAHVNCSESKQEPTFGSHQQGFLKR